MSTILPPSRWRSLAGPSFGMLGVLSASIGRAAASDPQSLPDLRQASALFIGTDYAGESPLVQFDAVTFLIADIRNLGQWVEARRRLRARYLPDGRRMAYSRLSDVQRSEALLPFLRAADSIPGLLASFLIDKRLGSVFTRSGHPAADSLPEFASWRGEVRERLLRVLHFAGVLLAGLSMPGQDVLWITDNDAIVPNVGRLTEATQLAAQVVSIYLPHTLGSFRFGRTAETEPGDQQIEDLLSLPDLVAGTLVDALTALRRNKVFPTGSVGVAFPNGLPEKPRSVLRWLANGEYGRPLKRLVYTMEPGQRAGKVTFSDMRFSGPGLTW